MTLAYSYARFSSEKQSRGTSLERQLKLTREYCELKKLTLDESLTDEGLSAFKNEHATKGSLGRFLEAVRSGKVPRDSFLICEHLDRLSRRETRSALTQMLMLLDHGIKIVTLFDGRVYSESSENIEVDLIIAILTMSEAYKSSLNKSNRVAAAWAIKRSNGKFITRKAPAWLDAKPDRSGFVENAGADVVRRIYAEAAQGIGSYVIASNLNRERVPTLTGSNVYGIDHPRAGQSVANGWNNNRVIAILKSDAVLGRFQPCRKIGKKRIPIGDPIENYFPVVVSQSIANKAREHIASRVFGGMGAGRKGNRIANLFTGVVKCRCGYAMHLNKKALRCGASLMARCDNKVGIPYSEFEKCVLSDFNLIKRVVLDKGMNDQAGELGEDIARKKAEMSRIEKRVSEMTSDLDMNFSVIKKNIESMTARFNLLKLEVESLDKDLKYFTNSDVADLERDYLLKINDVGIRSEIASLIRKTFIRNNIIFDDGVAYLMDFGEVACVYVNGEIGIIQKNPLRYLCDLATFVSKGQNADILPDGSRVFKI